MCMYRNITHIRTGTVLRTYVGMCTVLYSVCCTLYVVHIRMYVCHVRMYGVMNLTLNVYSPLCLFLPQVDEPTEVVQRM